MREPNKPHGGTTSRPGRFSQGRRNQRKADLWALHRAKRRSQSKEATNKTFDELLRGFARAFPGRNILDPNDITPAELGQYRKITFEERLDIERQETEFRQGRGWGTGPFKMRTVHPYDVTEAERKAYYAATRKRAQRQSMENNRMQQQTCVPPAPTTAPIDLRAAKMARTQQQFSDLIGVLGKEERTVAELEELVRGLSSWLDLPASKLRQTIYDRLNVLKEQDRITDRQIDGPRGSWQRAIRRKS